jgi:aminopeptidase N
VHAEAVTSPTADYDVTVTVPAGYDVLGTGVRSDDGHWRASAVRDFALSVGHFNTANASVDGIDVTVGVDQSVGEDPNVQLALITDALHAYAGRFGPYPWPSYSVAVTPGFHGGIEFPNHVMQAPGSAARSVVHEVAHQWFYSLVGNDQARDPWLDEGLASYAEFVQRGSLDEMAARGIPGSVRGHAADPMTFWEGRDSVYYTGVYVQSGVAVASLGTVDQVDCALRAYVARNAFRIATPTDLLMALTPVFPDAEGALAGGGVTIRR